jgi:hypothetical protein
MTAGSAQHTERNALMAGGGTCAANQGVVPTVIRRAFPCSARKMRDVAASSVARVGPVTSRSSRPSGVTANPLSRISHHDILQARLPAGMAAKAIGQRNLSRRAIEKTKPQLAFEFPDQHA